MNIYIWYGHSLIGVAFFVAVRGGADTKFFTCIDSSGLWCDSATKHRPKRWVWKRSHPYTTSRSSFSMLAYRDSLSVSVLLETAIVSGLVAG